MYKYLIVICICTACNQDPSIIESIKVNNLKSVCHIGGEPNLYVSATGRAYMSWIEYTDSITRQLKFTTMANKDWKAPVTIASGDNWFVNWADFPSIVAYNMDQSLAAHWLQKSAEGTYDYDIHISLSNDSGQTWSSSITPHRDGVAAEHGFVSMISAESDNSFFVAWLDGRNTKIKEVPLDTEEDASVSSDHSHGQGAMTIRCAMIDSEGLLTQEAELDNRVCDCCQTSVAMTSNGPIVAYRNRSNNEVRDIYLIRQVDGEWLEPQSVYNDGWRIEGCPVNGPVVRAEGEDVLLGWFTNADGIPKVQVAFSSDGGKNFDPPIRVDRGNPLGRVDAVLLSNSTGLVSWMEVTDSITQIYLAYVSNETKDVSIKSIAKTNAKRSSGFPQLEKTKEQIIMAWTHVDSLTTIESIAIDQNQFVK